MQNEDALNYDKTLQAIGGVGIAPVPVEISLASIAVTMQGIHTELSRMNVVMADSHHRFTALASQMQALQVKLQTR